MKIYWDMDGVVSDIDGTLADYAGITSQEVVQDRDLRTRLYLKRLKEVGISESFTSLKPTRKEEMKSLMRELHRRGHQLEILSSYGVRKEFFDVDILTAGAHIHVGKSSWLREHYRDLFEEGILTRFNGVANCEQKALYARPDSLLIDDTMDNVTGFVKGGGWAIHYELWRHDECVEQILSVGSLCK